MGFSFGGRTTLWANHLRFQERYGLGLSRFAGYLAFYPPCYIKLADEDRIGPAAVRIFHGAADDWTPIAPCREYVKRLRNGGKDVAMFEYPGAGHGFDNRLSAEHQALPGVANLSHCIFMERRGRVVDQNGRPAGFDSACVMRKASIGYSQHAHQQAITDVHNFLAMLFRLK
jgi:dienelactone hydrolase